MSEDGLVVNRTERFCEGVRGVGGRGDVGESDVAGFDALADPVFLTIDVLRFVVLNRVGRELDGAHVVIEDGEGDGGIGKEPKAREEGGDFSEDLVEVDRSPAVRLRMTP